MAQTQFECSAYNKYILSSKNMIFLPNREIRLIAKTSFKN